MKKRIIFMYFMLIFSYFTQYMILHSSLAPIFLIGFPCYLIIQTWMLNTADFYDNIKINVFASIIFFVSCSLIELIIHNDFLWYFRDYRDIVNFILVFWGLSTTIYFGLLFEHWLTKVLIPFGLQILLLTIHFVIAYNNFIWIDKSGLEVKVPLSALYIMFASICIVFVLNLLTSKWFSKKTKIQEREVF